MTDVWCVVGGGDGRDRYVAEGLIRAGNTVAVLKHNVAQLAMLVNEYGDSILSIEVRDAEEETLEEALRNVRHSFGHVDSIAVILEPWEDGLGEFKDSARRLAPGGSDFARAVGLLTAGLPASNLVIITGGTDSSAEDRLTSGMLNAALESRLRRAASTRQGSRDVSVHEITDFVAGLTPTLAVPG